METMIKNSSMGQLVLTDPPRIEGQLDRLYQSIKRLQSYCLTINVVPDMVWKDFMIVYRHGQDDNDHAVLENILNGKNQQKQLREYTAEYLDSFSIRISAVFQQISRFSGLFSACFLELERTINIRAIGAPDKRKDYQLVIRTLVEQVKKYGVEVKNLSSDLLLFSKKLKDTYQTLSFIRENVENFFITGKERIKQIEDELCSLHKALDKENSIVICRSCVVKEGIQFTVSSKTNGLSISKMTKNTDEDSTQAKKLEEKIAALQEELSRYDRDYAHIVVITDLLNKFLSAFYGVIQEIRAIGHSWDDLDQLFCAVEEILNDTNTSKECIINELLPFLETLKEMLIGLQVTISEFNEMLPMYLIVLEERNQQVVEHHKGMVLDSELLDIYLS